MTESAAGPGSGTRMSATEALMWAAERDPVLRSSFVNLTVLDGPVDMDRFRARMMDGVRDVHRLRQRVVEPFGPGLPEWQDDPDFDLDFHVRHIALPPPGTERQLLELAAILAQDQLDPCRPLWRYFVIEGLNGDQSVLLAQMHHAVTDGVGGVRLSAQFLDLERDPAGTRPKKRRAAQGDAVGTEVPAPPEPGPKEAGEQLGDEGLLGVVGRAAVGAMGVVRAAAGVGRSVVGSTAGAISRPAETVDTARSLARQLVITDGARSPLWSGRHSMRRRFEILRVPLDAAKAAAHSLGGTVNDFFVTGVAGGAGAYHRVQGAPVDELRMSMPISTRTDKSAGGNSFTPARVLVPAGIEDPAERFAAIHERLGVTKSERAFGLTDTLAGALTSLPSPLLLRLARQQVETVDFACSNVRGAPFDLFIAGARVLANHPMGPTAGTAFNCTTLSYLGSLDIGLNIDAAAVDDPTLLRDCIEAALAELLALTG